MPGSPTMKATPPKLADATLARLPIDRLGVLEAIRDDPAIVVAVRLDEAWVSWDQGRADVIARLLPVPGVQFFLPSESGHQVPGRWLPRLDVPADLADVAVPASRAILPEPIRPEPTGAWSPGTIQPSLADDDQPRPCSAWLGPLKSLADWADRAASAEIAALRGALRGGEALVMGDPPPWLPGGRRFWGRTLLCPLGKTPQPSMTDRAWAVGLGLSEGDRALLREDGLEVVPGLSVGTLGRAGIRLAFRGALR